MPYVPDPNDVTRPNDNDYVGQSAPSELRSIKGKILSEVESIEDLEEAERISWLTELATFESTMVALIQNAVEEFGELIDLHVDDRTNPHELTAEQLGLEKVNNFGVVTSEAEVNALPVASRSTTYVTSSVIASIKARLDAITPDLNALISDNNDYTNNLPKLDGQNAPKGLKAIYDVVRNTNLSYIDKFPIKYEPNGQYANYSITGAIQMEVYVTPPATAVLHHNNILTSPSTIPLNMFVYNGFNAITFPFVCNKHAWFRGGSIDGAMGMPINDYQYVYSYRNNDTETGDSYVPVNGVQRQTYSAWGARTTRYLYRNIKNNTLVPPRDSLVKSFARNEFIRASIRNAHNMIQLPANPINW